MWSTIDKFKQRIPYLAAAASRAERLYREAEWLNAWAYTLGEENLQAALNRGRQLILFSQPPIIQPGSAIEAVYEESLAQYQAADYIGRDVLAQALSHLVERIRTDGPAADMSGEALIVLNALPWERVDTIEIADGRPLMLADPEHSETVPLSQPITGGQGSPARVIEVRAPSYGYCAYGVQMGLPGQIAENTLRAERQMLESAELRMTLDANGEIVSLYDKTANRETVAPGQTANQLVAYEDDPIQSDAGDTDWAYQERPEPVREILDWQVIESGPVRASIEIKRCVGQSTITQKVCLWRHTRRIDFVTEADWRERESWLQALFPLNVAAGSATCEAQCGVVEPPTTFNSSRSVAHVDGRAPRWIDLGENDYGVALLNNGKHGHRLRHNVLSLSLLKGLIFLDSKAERRLYRFTYSLYPHTGDWREAELTRRAYELNSPLRSFRRSAPPERAQSEMLPPICSLLSTPTPHIIVDTVKMAEDDDGLIVRLYEVHNQRGPAILHFANAVENALEVNLLEQGIGPVAVADHELSFNVRPFEVKTFRVHLARGMPGM